MLCPFTQASPFPIPVMLIATGLLPEGATKFVWYNVYFHQLTAKKLFALKYHSLNFIWNVWLRRYQMHTQFSKSDFVCLCCYYYNRRMINFNRFHILIKITLYQINGWFVGKVDCGFHWPELPLDGPKSLPLRPIWIHKIINSVSYLQSEPQNESKKLALVTLESMKLTWYAHFWEDRSREVPFFKPFSITGPVIPAPHVSKKAP